MLWLLTYLIIGMVYVSFGMHVNVRRLLKEDKGDPNKEMITIVVTLVLICIFTPVWPALVTMRIAGIFYKKRVKE
ncbi:hypothetical protein ABEX53_07715 [Bacillus toyonensis]|uniref:hypothetical protein n=1 Tax=Bacillus toyonensis TaxID=155322 RepID=UPI000CD92725|nr:hypothetical protein [Bacillus toyonensis]MED3542039.1 hypothetical protein [Bacillus toyonensis]MEE2022425.1 hypothetical protein [Bacillus toyonensis]